MSTAIPTALTGIHTVTVRASRLMIAALLFVAVLAGTFVLGRVTTSTNTPVAVPAAPAAPATSTNVVIPTRCVPDHRAC